MQDVPALLASLHHLSGYENAGEYSSAQTADRDQADRERQARQRKEQQELDERAAVRARQFQQLQKNQEDAERRRAMQAAAAHAREEEADRAYKAHEAQVNRAARDHQQRPTTSRGPAAATTAPAVTSAAPPGFKYKVHACIEATSAEIAKMIADSEVRTRRLQEDLATKLREEASWGNG
jgi:hypothetical protein